MAAGKAQAEYLQYPTRQSESFVPFGVTRAPGWPATRTATEQVVAGVLDLVCVFLPVALVRRHTYSRNDNVGEAQRSEMVNDH